jgi:hypothetical protein
VCSAEATVGFGCHIARRHLGRVFVSWTPRSLPPLPSLLPHFAVAVHATSAYRHLGSFANRCLNRVWPRLNRFRRRCRPRQMTTRRTLMVWRAGDYGPLRIEAGRTERQSCVRRTTSLWRTPAVKLLDGNGVRLHACLLAPCSHAAVAQVYEGGSRGGACCSSLLAGCTTDGPCCHTNTAYLTQPLPWRFHW